MTLEMIFQRDTRWIDLVNQVTRELGAQYEFGTPRVAERGSETVTIHIDAVAREVKR